MILGPSRVNLQKVRKVLNQKNLVKGLMAVSAMMPLMMMKENKSMIFERVFISLVLLIWTLLIFTFNI